MNVRLIFEFRSQGLGMLKIAARVGYRMSVLQLQPRSIDAGSFLASHRDALQRLVVKFGKVSKAAIPDTPKRK